LLFRRLHESTAQPAKEQYERQEDKQSEDRADSGIQEMPLDRDEPTADTRIGDGSRRGAHESSNRS
jgi:hypothetical protein